MRRKGRRLSLRPFFRRHTWTMKPLGVLLVLLFPLLLIIGAIQVAVRERIARDVWDAVLDAFADYSDEGEDG